MIRPYRHNDALVAAIGYDYSYHKCPVDEYGVLQTNVTGRADLQALYGLINRRNASSFGGHPPGTLMFIGFSFRQTIWDVEIIKPNYGKSSQMVTSGFLDHVYPLADFTPLEAFLP